jgi:hypothetical protein
MGLEDYEAELAEESRRQRAELRRHRFGDERELIASLDRSRSLVDALREALHAGATLEVLVGTRAFGGVIHHVGEDLVTILDGFSNVVDIALSTLDAYRMVGPRSTGVEPSGAEHPSCIRDCLVVLEALGAHIEVPGSGDTTFEGRLVSLGVDFVTVRGGRAGGDWVLPTRRLSYVVTRHERARPSAADYLSARRALFTPG